MARNANATVPRCWYTLVRNRPTPGTPIAKSASLCSANSFTWRGVMICSASDFSSSGLSGAMSSAMRSPFTRTVAGRPTLSSRSEAPRWTIWVMACLKLNTGPICGASGMGIHPEERLSELDGLRVLHQRLANQPRDLGLDLVHDLHGFDDAHHLPRRDAAPHLHVRLRPRLGSGVERSHHGRLDLDQVARDGRGGSAGRGRRARGRSPLPRRGGGAGKWREGRPGERPGPEMRAAGIRRAPRLGHPDRRPRSEQPAPHLDRAQLGGVLQDLHQPRDDVEVHVSPFGADGGGIYTPSKSPVRPSDRSAGPAGDRYTSSSIRTPPWPA